MTPIAFKQVNPGLGLVVAFGWLALVLAGFTWWAGGFLQLADIVDNIGPNKVLLVGVSVVALGPAVFLANAVYKRTEVVFGPAAIEIRQGSAALRTIPYADIARAEMNRGIPGTLTLFTADGRQIERFRPFQQLDAVTALTDALARAAPFDVTREQVKLLGTGMEARTLIRR